MTLLVRFLSKKESSREEEAIHEVRYLIGLNQKRRLA